MNRFADEVSGFLKSASAVFPELSNMTIYIVGESFGITISKPGYATQSLTSEAQPDEAAIAKASRLAATSDALGRVIDVQDGAYYTHVPKAVVVKLDPAS